MKETIFFLLLASFSPLATAHAMGLGGDFSVVENEKSANDSTLHQPMTESSVKLDEVLVTSFVGNQSLSQSPAPVNVISSRQLEARPSSNIIDAISHQPGISQVTTGSGISKPVIRGLGYNRVLVVSDGVRQEGQQWGDEHGIEIDQHSVNSVEIVKGPASLRYGSDAMAGAIVFRSSPVLFEGETKFNIQSGYQTNNGLFDYSLNVQGNHRGFVWNTLYSGKFAHDYKNRYDGYVAGSGYREQSFSQMLGLNRNWGYSHLLLSLYHIAPGIVEGQETGGVGYGLSAPYQKILHGKVVSDNSFRLGSGSLKAIIGYQRNNRKEFEEEDSITECGLNLLLHTLTYDVHYDWQQSGAWQFSAGVNGMLQRSENSGTEYIIPDYHLFDFGLYAMASKKLGRWNLSGGVRYDRRRLHSIALPDEDSETGQMRFAEFRRTFQGVSGSVGATCQLAEGLNMKLNLSRGFRAPNISELGANGVHEGAQLYQKGNSSLKPETSWQLDFGLDYSTSIVYAQMALFANRIGNYIFSGRLADEAGAPVMSDGLPVYQYTSGDARILGGELSVDIHPTEHLHVGNSFSYVNSIQLHQHSAAKHLPFTPAPRWNADVKYEFVCRGRTFDNLYVKLAMECNFRQNCFYAENATETATPSYTLLHAYAGTDVRWHGKRILSLYLSCENIFDRAYQNHLSRLKYLGENPVTGRQGVYNMGRNVAFRVVVPISLGAASY